MTLTDLCFRVCTALQTAGANAVLTGGSAATFYAPHAYQSLDADFVITYGNSSAAALALARIGFEERDGMYRSAVTRYIVEFPPGPLMIGSEHVGEYAVVRRGHEILNVLHPIDCVRDRLLWYFHYDDFSALSAAVGVAEKQRVDMDRIREWSIRERALEKFELFNRQVSRATGGGPSTNPA